MFIVNDAQLFCQQEQEKERELLEDRLTTIKNYDAEAIRRTKELKESQLLIKRKEVLVDCLQSCHLPLNIKEIHGSDVMPPHTCWAYWQP